MTDPRIMQALDFITHQGVLGSMVSSWFYALIGALIGWAILTWVLRVSTRQLTARFERTTTAHRRSPLHTAAELLRSTRRWLILLLALALAFDTLTLSGHANRILGHIAFAVVAVQVALWCTALVRVWLENRHDADPQSTNLVLIGMLSWALKIAVWAIMLLAVLGDMGVNITAFVASLGVGGIALALGLQTLLKDVFASVSIGFDKPFVVGEFIMFGTNLGTVLKVGVRSTRIASLSGEELSISNSNLLALLIHNYSRMSKRRIVFDFRVPFDTPRQTVQTIVTQTQGFIKAESQATFDRGHFIAFSDSGYKFEFVYYVNSSDYTLYCDIQQRLNLNIMELLESVKAELAVPIRAVKTSAPPTETTDAAQTAASAAAEVAAAAKSSIRR
ncbi:MAG TPA: mechanosensitive ion channel family protein [Nevskiaceae bacterium]|nr:mechanosensitive ion channel family protein [Nevskiaceae bacterium]